MLSRRAKATFYTVAGPLMSLNGLLYKQLRAPRTGMVRAHLGPGQKGYLEGWINIDANIFTGKCDLWADLRNPLPFHDGTLDAVYSHHMVEHLPDVAAHIRDVHRCLKSGGKYRLAGPNGDMAIRKFIENDSEWFGDFPDKRASIGGRFENFIFCRQEHLTILTFSYLEELLTRSGFVQIQSCLPVRETGAPELFQDCLGNEWESDFDRPHTLVVEATKP
jgi:predicted SAM-dependent methyltransferase